MQTAVIQPWKRFATEIFPKVHIWRMSPADYDNAISNERIESRSLAMRNNLKNCELQDTAEKLLRKKCAAYQENILEELITDLYQ